ncbi:MAG: beta-lactamase family protein [candidate division WOR-3 bacterium]|nr:MAG: beta-lactamase family protein [candidate division WOR-3 bacterium]
MNMLFTQLDDYLTKCVKARKIPGCVCWVGNLSTSFFFEEYGHAQITPKKTVMKKETVFDLASLTKPIATALSIMILHEKKNLNIDQPIGEVLPSLSATGSRGSTIRQLLAHTSGLQPWYPTYLFPEETRMESIAGLNTGKEDTIYSCLGYIILGKIIERVGKEPIDRFFSSTVTASLGSHTLGFGPVKDQLTVAATEKGNRHELKMSKTHGPSNKIKWRKKVIQGEVHDGNAYYAYEGKAGNAGLFSNVLDLITFTRAYLSGEIIAPETLSLMLRDHTAGAEKRNLGWRLDPYPGLLSPLSFGHTGFTGTMVCVDPETNLIIIMLANAIHPKVKLGLMQPIREEAVRIISTILKRRRQ